MVLMAVKRVVGSLSHPYRMRTLRLASLLLMASCSGLVAFVYLFFRKNPIKTSLNSLFQRVLVQRLRWWIRRVISEEDMKARNIQNETAAMAAAISVKAASSAAAQVACLSQVMLAVKAEETHQTRNIVSALQAVSLTFMKAELIVRSFADKKDILAIKGHSSDKKYTSQWNDPSLKTNDIFDTTASKVLKTPQAIKENSAFQAPSFSEVMAMLERGETPPGIKKIDDRPPIPNQLPSVSCLKPKPKPWEMEGRA